MSNFRLIPAARCSVVSLSLCLSVQLSQLSSATLLSWLKGRGVVVSAKHRKEELMLKVMGCLAEAWITHTHTHTHHIYLIDSLRSINAAPRIKIWCEIWPSYRPVLDESISSSLIEMLKICQNLILVADKVAEVTNWNYKVKSKLCEAVCSHLLLADEHFLWPRMSSGSRCSVSVL